MPDPVAKADATGGSESLHKEMNLSEHDDHPASGFKQEKASHYGSDGLSFSQNQCSESEKNTNSENNSNCLPASHLVTGAASAEAGKALDLLDTSSLGLSLGLNRIKTRAGPLFEDGSDNTSYVVTKTSSTGVIKSLATQQGMHFNSAAPTEGSNQFGYANQQGRTIEKKQQMCDPREILQGTQAEGLVLQALPSNKGTEQTATVFSTSHVCGSGSIACMGNQFVKSQSHTRQGCHKKEPLAEKKTLFHLVPYPESDCSNSLDTEGLPKQLDLVHDTESTIIQSIPFIREASTRKKRPKDVKSFSHELGLKGVHSQGLPRRHSDTNLEDLLEALQVRFNTAKEEADVELAVFAADLIEILNTCNDSLVDWKEKIEDLLILARGCVIMSACDFQKQCESIVQELDDKLHELPMGFLKQLHTRVLFILTRCTRLLQFHKATGTQEEGSFEKVQRCLRGVPSFERVWVEEKGRNLERDSLKQQSGSFVSKIFKSENGENKTYVNRRDVLPEADCLDPFKPSFASSNESLLSTSKPVSKLLSTSKPLSKGTEEKTILEEPDQFICRICEEEVPTLHLEAHSTLCAFADACDGNGLSVNERLINMADILGKISEVGDKPDVFKFLKWNLHDGSNNSSPKSSDLHGKVMDARSNQGVASSSAGSLTPRSSITTPRTSQLDLLWAEHSMSIESEDVQQIHELADIARCVANKNPVDEGDLDYLAACMHDLQDILAQSKNEALAVGIFGRHIEGLLREKDMLVYEAVSHQKSLIESSFFEDDGIVTDDSFYDLRSTTSHPLYKDRTTIDDFEILKPISRGTFGKVFLARKRTTRDLFAIKVLRKADMIRKNAVENILAERDILITVCNPFVVRFFYSFTCRENLYLVMEYLNGGDLFSLLRNMGCLDEHVARVYIAELVLALEYLHSIGVVHRDLKPDNILIAHDGHIKLTDFGLSKVGLINSTKDFSNPSANGTVLTDTKIHESPADHTNERVRPKKRSAVGTPDYLAPEILLGREHGHPADWWSAGVILFECLTGMPPFNAEHPQIVFENILNRKIPWPGLEDMSYEARDIIDQLLIQNPSQRLGSRGASEVKSHLFFREINWETLAMQKVAFVPSPESVDDTSYFTSRPLHDQCNSVYEHMCSRECSCGSSISTSSGKGRLDEEEDECAELADLHKPIMRNSFNNFSFKNLPQLASINYDLFSHSMKDLSKSSS